MKKHSNKFIRFFQVFLGTVVFTLLSFCTSLKASSTFTQDFLSTCYTTSDFTENPAEYTVLRTEFVYKNTSSTVQDILVLQNKTKKVLVLREFRGKANAVCVLSVFTNKKRT